MMKNEELAEVALHGAPALGKLALDVLKDRLGAHDTVELCWKAQLAHGDRMRELVAEAKKLSLANQSFKDVEDGKTKAN